MGAKFRRQGRRVKWGFDKKYIEDQQRQGTKDENVFSGLRVFFPYFASREPIGPIDQF
jgi:hypothetical protein